MKAGNGIYIKISKALIFIMLSFFQNCDTPISDRVAIEKVCPRMFYRTLLLLSLSNESSKNSNSSISINAPLLASEAYKSCLDRHPFGGTLITPLDDLLWNGCGRCYK